MACWIACQPTAQAESAPLDYIGPNGLRMDRYRAPTPPKVPHARTLNTVQLLALMRRADPVLIDVQPVVVRPETEEFGMEWLPGTQRQHIPGSIWLPNVGYGKLEPPIEHYFRDALRRATGGDYRRALVFYCVLDCWMSWNAVQRATAYGYSNLYWYRGGTDEWKQDGQPLVEAIPVPIGKARRP